MTEREFICLDCGAHAETFLEDCPSCGSRQFESMAADDTEPSEEPLTDEIAKLTRPVNPIAPATGD